MKRTALFGTLVLASMASAFAADLAGDIGIEPHAFVPSRSRSEVQAELAQFKQAGINPWSISYNPLKYVRSTRSRADVAREYVAAREEVRATTAEDSGSLYRGDRQPSGVGTQLAGPAYLGQ